MKKSLFVAIVCMLLGFTAKSQISIDVYNNLPRDVDLNVVALGTIGGIPCRDVANSTGAPGYPLTNITPFNSVIGVYSDVAPSYEYEMYLRVDPSGSNTMISTIGASTLCGYGTKFDVVVPSCGLVHVRVTPNVPGGNQYTMLIYL